MFFMSCFIAVLMKDISLQGIMKKLHTLNRKDQQTGVLTWNFSLKTYGLAWLIISYANTWIIQTIPASVNPKMLALTECVRTNLSWQMHMVVNITTYIDTEICNAQ